MYCMSKIEYDQRIQLNLTINQRNCINKQAEKDGLTVQELLRGYVMIGLISDGNWPALKEGLGSISLQSYQYLQTKVLEILGKKISI